MKNNSQAHIYSLPFCCLWGKYDLYPPFDVRADRTVSQSDLTWILSTKNVHAWVLNMIGACVGCFSSKSAFTPECVENVEILFYNHNSHVFWCSCNNLSALVTLAIADFCYTRTETHWCVSSRLAVFYSSILVVRWGLVCSYYRLRTWTRAFKTGKSLMRACLSFLKSPGELWADVQPNSSCESRHIRTRASSLQLWPQQAEWCILGKR